MMNFTANYQSQSCLNLIGKMLRVFIVFVGTQNHKGDKSLLVDAKLDNP